MLTTTWMISGRPDGGVSFACSLDILKTARGLDWAAIGILLIHGCQTVWLGHVAPQRRDSVGAGGPKARRCDRDRPGSWDGVRCKPSGPLPAQSPTDRDAETCHGHRECGR